MFTTIYYILILMSVLILTLVIFVGLSKIQLI